MLQDLVCGIVIQSEGAFLMILCVKIFPHADQEDLLWDLPDGISGKLNQFFRHKASFVVRKQFLIHAKKARFL